MEGRWIRKKQGATSIVFVHGVLSSGESCWTSESGCYWPELVSKNTSVQDTGIYVFTYKTNFFSGTYRIGDAVDSLIEAMTLDGVDDAGRIIFVCHSMGGLLVK